jgi:calcium-dependent protein kinase
MEFCSGGELLDSILKQGAYTEFQASKIMEKLVKAVMFLHSKNIAHRDLKPENFLFENEQPNAELKIIDFGLASRYASTYSMCSLVGTP